MASVKYMVIISALCKAHLTPKLFVDFFRIYIHSRDVMILSFNVTFFIKIKKMK